MTESSVKVPAPSRYAACVPIEVKLLYSTFVAVLVPVYWHYYGPTNFLYFCDVALLLTLIGIWIESPLLISMCAVGILLPQMIWVADFATHFFGVSLVGTTDYNSRTHRFFCGDFRSSTAGFPSCLFT